MGFGLLWLLGRGAAKGAASVANAVDNERFKRETYNGETYRDNRGQSYLAHNGHPCYWTSVYKTSFDEWRPAGVKNLDGVESGDFCLIDKVTMEIIKNRTAEKRLNIEMGVAKIERESLDKDYQEAKERGYRAVYRMGNGRLKGTRFEGRHSYSEDLNSDDIYVDVLINTWFYYFNIKTLRVVDIQESYRDEAMKMKEKADGLLKTAKMLRNIAEQSGVEDPYPRMIDLEKLNENELWNFITHTYIEDCPPAWAAVYTAETKYALNKRIFLNSSVNIDKFNEQLEKYKEFLEIKDGPFEKWLFKGDYPRPFVYHDGDDLMECLLKY